MRKILLLLIFTLSIYAEVIASFDTKLAIRDSSTANVKESIVWDFGSNSRHGIYRDIPKNGMRIKNLKIYQDGSPAEYKLMDKGKFWRIRVGSGNRFVSGKVNYQIDYNLLGEVVRQKDEKHYIIADLIGTGFKKPIKVATATIFLPKKLQGKIEAKAFRGRFGSKERVEVKNLGDRLELKTTNLAPKEGLTVSINFDPSLMALGKKPSDKYWENPIYYLFLTPVFALFYFFAKKFNIFGDIGSIAPKYRAPKDLTVMEAGLLKDNFVDFEEIKPAILELANLGYLKIEEDEDGLFLTKTKEADNSLSREQEYLMEAIFGFSEVMPADSLKIDKSMFETIREELHEVMIEKGYFGSSIKSARSSLIFAAFGVGAISIGVFAYYAFSDTVFEKAIPLIVSIGFLSFGVFNLIGAIKSREFGAIVFSSVWILFSSIFLISVIGSKDLAISLILMILIIATGSYLIYRKMNTLTFKGALAKRHLLGLKEFIDKADKDKIKYFLKEDKKYLDKMLPYAVLFGLNKHWLELYQELDAPMPDWYSGSWDSFEYIDFSPSLNGSSSFSDGISDFASIDSGDFGGFGDFSGGGFGGGGGDSW